MHATFLNNEVSIPIIGYDFKQTHDTQPIFGKVYLQEPQSIEHLLGLDKNIFVFDGDKYYSFKEFECYKCDPFDQGALSVVYFKSSSSNMILSFRDRYIPLDHRNVYGFEIRKYGGNESIEVSVTDRWVGNSFTGNLQWLNFSISSLYYSLNFDVMNFDTAFHYATDVSLSSSNWDYHPTKVDYQKEGF